MAKIPSLHEADYLNIDGDRYVIRIGLDGRAYLQWIMAVD